VIYVLVGLVIAVVGGFDHRKLRMERYVEISSLPRPAWTSIRRNLTKRDRLVYAKEQMAATFKKVFPYILVGVGIGAVIHNWIPKHGSNWRSATIKPVRRGGPRSLAMPMYADIFGTITIAEALFYKGAQLGTILSFMMAAVTTLSRCRPWLMLRKAVKPKLLALFIAICTVGIILVGYLFNALQGFIV
jgi:uncharacterized membrane protein YraQ (UPF0718 family)